jgi:hypothetical protein
MATISFAKQPTKGLVSIIIPTYRKEHLIGETLATIGKQTYRNWEVVVVEDGGERRSEKIVREFSRRNRWHHVDYSCSDRNYGAGHTRNIAFTKARGEYIALLDSDDRWFPDHLQVSVDALETTGKDIVYSTVVMVEDQTDLVLGTWGPLAHELADFPHSLFGRSFITPSATVLRRQVLADVGPWDTHLKYCEDFSYWLRCIEAGKKFHCVSGCHCLYRKNHEGATTQRLCGTLEEVAEVTEQFMNMPGMRHKTLRRCASKAFLLAARFHNSADPTRDPSADPTRTAGLLLHAWRLRPKRVGHLVEGCLRKLGDLIRRRKPRVLAPAASHRPADNLPRRAAA